MTTFLFVIIILCTLAAIVSLVVKSQGSGEKTHRITKSGKAGTDKDIDLESQWRAVKIRPGLICCIGATELADQVYLSKEAPGLPLGSCAERDCSCHYVHLKDRRSGTDRRIDLGKMSEYAPNPDRDRRLTPIGRRLGDAVA